MHLRQSRALTDVGLIAMPLCFSPVDHEDTRIVRRFPVFHLCTVITTKLLIRWDILKSTGSKQIGMANHAQRPARTSLIRHFEFNFLNLRLMHALTDASVESG